MPTLAWACENFGTNTTWPSKLGHGTMLNNSFLTITCYHCYHARNSSLPWNSLQPWPRRLVERRGLAALRRDRSGVSGRTLQEASLQLREDRSEPHRAGRRRRAEQPLHPGGRFFKKWQGEGVLFTEADPAIYVYYQEFTYAGTTYIRRGFLARQRLSRFGEGQVFPHEETLPGPKVDRLMLMAVTKANLSPIFGLYPDPRERGRKPAGPSRGRQDAASGHRSSGRGPSALAGDRCVASFRPCPP